MKTNTLWQKYLDEFKCITNKSNSIYSPVSTRHALQLYSYFKIDDVNEYIGNTNYLKYSNIKNALTYINRVWINKSAHLIIPEEIIDYCYRLDMSNVRKATKIKNDFVADCTDNFIKNTPTILDDSVKFDIMNITYFKDTWYKKSYVKRPLQFTNIDNKQVIVDSFKAEIMTAYENDTCYVAKLDYKHDCSFYAIKPKKSLEEVNLNNLKLVKYNKINLITPIFTAEDSHKLNDIFNIKCDIIQTAKIELDEKGTKAAAVTEIVTKCAVKPTKKESLDIILNSPFYYMIEDTKNEDIIFIGSIGQLG